jgi:hypothetical protein
MPKLPTILAQKALPSEGGVARAQASFNPPGMPSNLSPGPFQVAANAIVNVGQAIQDAGQMMGSAMGQQQKVKDTASAEQATQGALQEWDQEELADREQPRTTTTYSSSGLVGEPADVSQRLEMPSERRERLTEMSNDLIARHGESLSPRARMMFENQTRQYMTARLHSTGQQDFQRFHARSVQSLQDSVTYHSQGALHAQSPVEAGLHINDLQRVLGEAVGSGLITQPTAALQLQNAVHGLQVQEATLAVVANPAEMYQQLQAVTRGETVATAEIQNAPRDALPQLTQTARKLWHEQLSKTEHEEAVSARRLKGTQEEIAGAVRGEVALLDATPDNVPTLRTYLTQVNTLRDEKKITAEDHQQLTGTIRSRLDTAMKPEAERDDPVVERDLSIQLHLADRPQDFDALEKKLQDGAGALRPETVRTLSNAIAERRRANHYSNRVPYQDGKELLLRAAIVPGTIGGAGMVREETQRQLLDALQAYDKRMSELAAQDPREMDRQARTVAQEIKEVFLAPDITALPPTLQEANTEAELAVKLRAMTEAGLPLETARKYRQQWEDDQKLLREAAENAARKKGKK